jgi:glycine/D-amino acid oxidase-like deaminating enzyme
MRVLIVGGGVVGTSIAYHLTVRGAEAVVIEREAVACAASGKSGGFLALDWCDGTPLMALAGASRCTPSLRQRWAATGVTAG